MVVWPPCVFFLFLFFFIPSCYYENDANKLFSTRAAHTAGVCVCVLSPAEN